MLITEIKNLNQKRKALETELLSTEAELKRVGSLEFFSKYKLRRLLKRVEKEHLELKEEVNIHIDDYLFNEHETFIELNRKNRELLTRNEFVLNVYKTEHNPFIATTEYEFRGNIHENGYLYMSLVETTNSLTNLNSSLMPKILEGGFNEYGDFTAKTVKRSFHPFMYRIPKYYMAKADNDYKFSMHAGGTEWDVGGREVVFKMIGDPFENNDLKRSQFLSNRNEIRVIRRTFVDSL